MLLKPEFNYRPGYFKDQKTRNSKLKDRYAKPGVNYYRIMKLDIHAENIITQVGEFHFREEAILKLMQLERENPTPIIVSYELQLTDAGIRKGCVLWINKSN